MKSIWLSALRKDEDAVKKMMAQLKTYGLEAKGHFWRNDNAKMAWLSVCEEIVKQDFAFWAILSSSQELNTPELRYGLALAAFGVQAQKGNGFPIIILQTDDNPLATDQLPTPLRQAIVLPAAAAGTPAKLVAKSHAKPQNQPLNYYLNMAGSPQVGQWFEIRPVNETWTGMIFGVDQGDIAFQAVGPAGTLPEKSALNFPMQGLKLTLADTEFTAWALRNEISKDNAYYVKVNGFPSKLIFGPYAEDDATEMFVVDLQ